MNFAGPSAAIDYEYNSVGRTQSHTFKLFTSNQEFIYYSSTNIYLTNIYIQCPAKQQGPQVPRYTEETVIYQLGQCYAIKPIDSVLQSAKTIVITMITFKQFFLTINFYFLLLTLYLSTQIRHYVYITTLADKFAVTANYSKDRNKLRGKMTCYPVRKWLRFPPKSASFSNHRSFLEVMLSPQNHKRRLVFGLD